MNGSVERKLRDKWWESTKSEGGCLVRLSSTSTRVERVAMR